MQTMNTWESRWPMQRSVTWKGNKVTNATNADMGCKKHVKLINGKLKAIKHKSPQKTNTHERYI